MRDFSLHELAQAAIYSTEIRETLRIYGKQLVLIGDRDTKSVLQVLRAAINRHGDVDFHTISPPESILAQIREVECNPELLELCVAIAESPIEVQNIIKRGVCQNIERKAVFAMNYAVNELNIQLHEALDGDIVADIRQIVDARQKLISGFDSARHKTLGAIELSVEAQKDMERYDLGMDCLGDIIRPVPGSLMVIGGMSATGKTSLANQMAINLVMGSNLRCLYFSLEVTDEMTYQTMLQYMLTRVGDIDEAKKKLAEIPMNIYTTTFTLDDILNEIMAQKAKDPKVRFVVIDYLQVLEISGKSNESEMCGEAIRQIQNLTTSLGLFTIVLSQIRKEEGTTKKVNGKPAKEFAPPDHNDYRGSGRIFNAAYYALMLYFSHPSEDKFCDEPRIFFREKLRILKNKTGMTRDIKVTFDPKNRRFLSGWDAWEEKYGNGV